MDDYVQFLRQRGASLVGFADLSEAPIEVRGDMPRGVSLAVALDPATIAGITGGPTQKYFELYKSANLFLNELAAAAADYLVERGHRVLAWPSTGGIDDKTLSVRVQHKTIATRAGLGWIGKCALCITPQYGGAQRFASVLTDAPLPVAKPINESRCGTCRACVDVCPASAPSGKDWKLGMAREEFFDAFACRDSARARAAKMGDGVLICGMCIAACPHTVAYLKRSGV